jgi:hypothetical protein
MKAVRFDHYGDIEVLDVVEVPDPVPGEGQVLVRVKAAGINPGEPRSERAPLITAGRRRSHPAKGATSQA